MKKFENLAHASKPHDHTIPLLIHYFVVHGSSLQKKSAPYIWCTLYMDKVRKLANTRKCALYSDMPYSREITVLPPTECCNDFGHVVLPIAVISILLKR